MLLLCLILFILLVYFWLAQIQRRKKTFRYRRAPLAPADSEAAAQNQGQVRIGQPKPQWVVKEVLRIKALMGKQAGCRTVAHTFNRLHAPQSVGKTYVHEVIQTHQLELLNLTRDLRGQTPKALPTHAVWAMDVTHVAACGKPQTCLGILDHGSRLCIRLTTLINKRSWTLLGYLCLAIGQYGKPRAVRTDNEAIFNSFVFTTFLKLAGIRKQTTPVCAPWCNGRIERFFSTIKPWLRQLVHQSISDVQNALQEAAWFYNHVRPHQNLKGLTPKEARDGLVPEDLHQGARDTLFVQTLDGVLCGYWIRR